MTWLISKKYHSSKFLKKKVRLSRRFDVFSIHLSTKHNDQSPICVWCIHPVPNFTNLVIAVPISQKINLVELIVGRTSMKSTLVTRELRDHILVRNDLKWRSYKYLQNLGNFKLKVELCKLENVVWYITFQDFILNVQKPNFLISDDLCDDKEIVAVPLRNFSSKEKPFSQYFPVQPDELHAHE